VPRIDAPTLIEHRERRRSALLQAAHDLALEGGARSVTMGAVAARADLSRPAVYEYYPNIEALLGALLLAEMRTWAEEVGDAVAVAEAPEAKVDAYIVTTLALVSAGRHRLAGAVAGVALPADVAAEIGRLHHTMAAPLELALGAAGVPDPGRAAQYLQGVVNAATVRIEAGADAEVEAEAARAFVRGGVASMA
jgi:AcrR family transcriptional regulator